MSISMVRYAFTHLFSSESVPNCYELTNKFFLVEIYKKTDDADAGLKIEKKLLYTTGCTRPIFI